MAKKKPQGQQLTSFPEGRLGHQISINLDAQDDFVNSHGVDWIHYRAIPSPIGLKDRGEYRKVDAADVIASNGFIYKCAGEFSGVIVSNSKGKDMRDGGLFDESVARLIMPRFYNSKEGDSASGKEIHLAPGDRIFIKDLETKVPNYQRLQYNPDGVDLAQFPILEVEDLIDSRGIEYTCGKDFTIKDGNIAWLPAGKNPGIDSDTGRGRVYGVRYLYNAHWYILSIPKEVRVGRATEGGVRKPARMPYYAVIQREYVYHNQVNSGNSKIKERKDDKPSRKAETPVETKKPVAHINVSVSSLEDEE
jgi:hypothetical protein